MGGRGSMKIRPSLYFEIAIDSCVLYEALDGAALTTEWATLRRRHARPADLPKSEESISYMLSAEEPTAIALL
ncbi:hypothetical protein CBOM_08049 [Ceraceosorus bombacis]|uniref:Uncharacterized protein n=1 Tax=Ceraceosorus bombacis TaxID=401625 RepID=A0A0P1BKB1_9BASI|nr:hypothetical protein CBOM_08049 [Ceraceosorus bombacis]